MTFSLLKASSKKEGEYYELYAIDNLFGNSFQLYMANYLARKVGLLIAMDHRYEDKSVDERLK